MRGALLDESRGGSSTEAPDVEPATRHLEADDIVGTTTRRLSGTIGQATPWRSSAGSRTKRQVGRKSTWPPGLYLSPWPSRPLFP